MRPSNRAVSTVVDVGLALVMMSAGVAMIAVYVNQPPDLHEPQEADRTAEMVASTTLSVEYDIQDVESEPEFDETWVEDDDAYNRVRHGTTAELLASAAVANATYFGTDATVTADAFEEAVDGRLRTSYTGSDVNVHIRAVWRPFPGSNVQGVATAGPRPPADEDVSSVTMTAPSGFNLRDDELSDMYSTYGSGGVKDQTEQEMAEAIVEGQFPVRQTQQALESQGMERQLTVYRYRKLAQAVGHSGPQFDPDEPADRSHVNRSGADAEDANDRLANRLDEGSTVHTGIVGEGLDMDSSAYESEDEFVEYVTVDEVELIIRTWNP